MAKRRFVWWRWRADVIKACSRQSPRRTAARASEGGTRLGVPGRRCDLLPLARGQPGSEQGDDREQGEQAGRGSGDSLVRPLPLHFDAEVSADFLEGDLNTPAPHEEGHNLRGVCDPACKLRL